MLGCSGPQIPPRFRDREMSRAELIKLLTASLDRIVKLTFNDATAQTVKVHIVDDEGIVYFAVSSNGIGEQAYWTVIEDIESVLPLEDS